MTELAIVSCIVSLSLLCAAALDAGTRETVRLEARRAAMQAEVDHACGVNLPPVPPSSR
jgi:hypothetical protein